jgi:hypothetical protein
MATFVQFRGYGVHGDEVNIDVERVTHFYSINYNGNAGVELALDNGKIIRVDGYSFDVGKKIKEALAPKEQRP